MTSEPSSEPALRSGFLLGLGCVVGLTLVALFAFGRPVRGAAGSGAKPGDVPVTRARRDVGRGPVRSSAQLRLDEARNLLPDAPELGSSALLDLRDRQADRLKALAVELNFADESRFFGINQRAAAIIDDMMQQPRWKTLAEELELSERRWLDSSAEDRAAIYRRQQEVYDEFIAALRARF